VQHNAGGEGVGVRADTATAALTAHRTPRNVI
jgi:hypothetical protein